MQVSSAYMTVSPSVNVVTMSFVYVLYRDGPRFVPWLTPFWLFLSFDVCSFIFVFTVLFARKFFSHLFGRLFMPMFSSLLISMLLFTTSKADVWSKNTVRTRFPWSICFITCDISWWQAVAVE
uniref:Uncharacterized protein n=1 Tax=Cacopsylla melanoneura TaxID=428564 RepID=A0A8D8V149_9HEMI